MKNNKQKYIIGALALLPLLTTGCKESWLGIRNLSLFIRLKTPTWMQRACIRLL